jgi:hypothetical protein
MGIALNLEENTVSAVILGDYSHIKEGDEVRCTGRVVEVPVGNELIGRVVDPLGNPLDEMGPIKTTKTRYAIGENPAIMIDLRDAYSHSFMGVGYDIEYIFNIIESKGINESLLRSINREPALQDKPQTAPSSLIQRGSGLKYYFRLAHA